MLEKIIHTPIINIYDGYARIFQRIESPEENDLVLAYYQEHPHEEHPNSFIVLLDTENMMQVYHPDQFIKYYKLAGQESQIIIKQNYTNQYGYNNNHEPIT